MPASCFVRLPDRPSVGWFLVGGGDRPRAWSHHGYGEELTDLPPKTAVAVLTPQPLAAVFSAGYAPDLHPSARRPPSRSAT